MEAISGESSFSRNTREQDEARYRSGNLVLWLAAIAVLVGLNFASWSFCMWVFGQPEHPLNYRLLTRLEKLDPIHGFLPVTAPRGKFYSTKDLYAHVYPFGEAELGAFNGILKRLYLTNYKERDDVTYLSGEFAVETVQEMTRRDVFPSGLVIRARSTTFPDALVDLALPSENVPESFDLKKGELIQLQESSMCAAVLHVDRREDTSMVFTVVPLVTRTPSPADQPPAPKRYEFAEGAVIEVSTPPRIRLDPERWPISEEDGEIEEMPEEMLSPGEEAAEEEGGESEGADEPADGGGKRA